MSLHYAFTGPHGGCPKCYAGGDCWQYRKLEDQEMAARTAYENSDNLEQRGRWLQARKALRRHGTIDDNADSAAMARRGAA